LRVTPGEPRPDRGGAPDHESPRGAARGMNVVLRREASLNWEPLGALRLRAAIGMPRRRPRAAAARQR